mmetsp:Transcript_146184/g.253949  ORF Transcript_146184/g.253949 Transcript_146184/m.253949 type:complete len:141 (-) Transcript_146184:10-432(-)
MDDWTLLSCPRGESHIYCHQTHHGARMPGCNMERDWMRYFAHSGCQWSQQLLTCNFSFRLEARADNSTKWFKFTWVSCDCSPLSFFLLTSPQYSIALFACTYNSQRVCFSVHLCTAVNCVQTEHLSMTELKEDSQSCQLS